MRRILQIAILVATACASLAQQRDTQERQPGQRQPTFRVQSNLVVVDCTVKDRKGNLVRDLKKEDFVVYEDGVPQELVTFSLEEVPVEAAAAEEAPDRPAAAAVAAPPPATINLSATPAADRKKEDLKNRRLIVLFFDLSSLNTEDLIRSVETAEDFINKKSTPHDLIAVASYSSTLQLVQDLTNDRAALVKVLKQINPTEAGDAAEQDLGDTTTAEDTFVPDDIQFNIFNTDRRLSALESLAKAYREFPERKSLIYFSSGLQTTGIENQSQIRSTVDAANQSNMSIYTIDSRGLQALPPGGGASRGGAGGRAMFTGDAMARQTASISSSQETLSTLAHDTGGTAFQETNALAPVFDKVLDDTRSYYIVGYYSSNAREDGRFRKIKIEVKRADLRLQHRPGYFASKQFTRLSQSERERQLEEAFNVDRPFSDLPFILEADYFKENGSNCMVPVTLQLAGDGVSFEEKGNRREAEIEFLARITDPQGKVAGIARDVVSIRLPVQRAEKVRTGQILYSTGFELRPGEYRLKFLMRDNRSGKLGSFEQPLAVPQLTGKSLQTSSIVLGSRLVDAGAATSAGIEHRNFERDGFPGRDHGPRGPGGPGFGPVRPERRDRDPLTFSGKKVVPSIGNVFLRGQHVYVYFQVYGASADPATRRPNLEARLMFLDGKRKVRESEPHVVEQWSDGVATVAMSVPLAGLRRGSYALQLHLRDNVGDHNLFQRVPIVVQ